MNKTEKPNINYEEKEGIEQKFDEIRELLNNLDIEFSSFSLRLFMRAEEKSTLEQVNNILLVVENMASFENTMGMDEFGEPVSILEGYNNPKKLTEEEKINGILDRAGIKN